MKTIYKENELKEKEVIEMTEHERVLQKLDKDLVLLNSTFTHFKDDMSIIKSSLKNITEIMKVQTEHNIKIQEIEKKIDDIASLNKQVEINKVNNKTLETNVNKMSDNLNKIGFILFGSSISFLFSILFLFFKK